MAQLHELLAAEKTKTSAWMVLVEETLKKFGNPTSFFQGSSRSLTMLDDSPTNKATEAAARESKALVSTVWDTLDYALDIFVVAEDLQAQKNATNAAARGSVMWNGEVLLADMPVDELLGLEARLTKILQLVQAIPTVDASKKWVKDEQNGRHRFCLESPIKVTKTDKVMTPVVLYEATDKHPAQVEKVAKDVVIGTFEDMRFSGEATALQKADAIQAVNRLMVEVKQARMRANTTPVVSVTVGATIKNIIMDALSGVPTTKGI